jgi:HAD superfamily hydrolase (TIGR01509 family)
VTGTVRVVLFDVMDTVLADPFLDALRAGASVPLEEVFARRDPTLWPAFECGHLDEEAYWDGWRTAGLTVDREAFHRVRRAGTGYLDGMAELLDDLAGAVQRVTASNYPVWIDELERDHLDGRFERVLSSYHLGVRKPDAVFFERLLDEVGCTADEARFVDDRQVNVDAAARVGIRSHRFVDAPTLRRWLAAEGVARRPG